MQIHEFDLLVLCGGAGSRMKGEDKPLLSYHGRPMIDLVVSSVPDAQTIWISANRNTAQYSQWGQVFEDLDVDVKVNASGPLVGILGALDRTQADWLLVSPGDSPQLAEYWYAPLFAQTNAQGAVIFDGERNQNLHLLLATSTAADLRAYLNGGRYQVWQWLAEIAVVPTTAVPAEGFKNVNSPKDF
ncbi:MAG: molybdopterin-guanine dinucleotide biosynthesis protein A [Limisphaerales bacterium]|jgi:molybdopterin-guanine dinucleotide biosynthesis protein A